VPHLHLPVQSGSDRILAAMKRGYTVLEYKSIVRRLRALRPDLSLTSDFIVGFPGESDDDFEQTMKLAAEIDFDGAFTFALQSTSGTPAATSPIPSGGDCAGTARAPGGLLDADYRDYSEAMVGTRSACW
jgi:tRNA-2-methylthio-N6-dimethylallyladenosine synthase